MSQPNPEQRRVYRGPYPISLILMVISLVFWVAFTLAAADWVISTDRPFVLLGLAGSFMVAAFIL